MSRETTPARSVERTILVLSVCGFASALSTRFVDPMIGVIARDLSADPLSVALLSSAYALPYAFIQPILGPVGDALGKERVVKVVMVSLAIMLGAAAVAPGLSSLFLFRILSGAAAGGIIPIALATIGDKVAMADRQVAIGRFLTATISGQLLGGVGSGVLAEYIGWRGVFGSAAILAGVSAGAVLLSFRGSEPPNGELSFSAASRRYRHILSIGKARALMAFVFAEGILIFGVQPYLAPLLERAQLGGAREAGLIIGAFGLGGLVYTFMVGWLLRTLGLGLMLKVAGVLGLGAYLALAPALPWGADAAAMLLLGLGFYMLHNSFQTQMTEVAPEARASAVAMHAFAFFVGQAIGPVAYGAMLAGLGRAGAMTACGLGVLAMGLAASAVFGERGGRRR